MLLGPYPPPSGGVATYVSAVYRAFGAGECVWYGYSEKPLQAEYLHVTAARDFDPAARLLSESRAKIVLDSATVFLEYLNVRLLGRWLVAVLLKRVRWIKVIHDVNLPNRFSSYSAIQRGLVRFAGRFVWRYVAINEELADWLVREVAPPHKVMVIPSLIEVSALAGPSAIPPEIARMSEVKDYLVCATGAMNPDYGFQHVADAVRRLEQERRCRIGLLIICTDFARESGFTETLRKTCPEISVLRDLPHNEVLAVFRCCDVVVRSVRKESYGLSRVEAICQETPVVATRTGETRGMLCYEFGDIDGLIQQLNTALTEEARSNAQHWAQFYAARAAENRQHLLDLLDEAGAT